MVKEGSVAELHALDPFVDGAPSETEIWTCRPAGAAVVLGSRQHVELLDERACAAAGLAIVRRRSGGGAVVVRPGETVWIDLVVPPGVAPDDVRGSMIWAGELWRDALAEASAGLQVHRGGMVTTPWSELVCFAGTGPGEVLVGGRKLVGLSQRRTRHGVRIQGLVHTTSALGAMRDLFAVSTPDADLDEPATLAAVGLADLAEASLADRLAAAVAARIAAS
jgi:lipoate-protein ligase A